MSRILYVEDDAASARVMHNRLRDAGYEVIVAENGAKGLLEARESRFDTFLLSAAVSSGLPTVEVCRRLKQMPASNAVPTIVFARSATMRDEGHQLYEAGVDAFLPKSELGNLEDVLKAQLRQRAQREELAEQNRVLADQLRRLQETQTQGDAEGAGGRADPGQFLRDLGANRPDGLLLVDAEGIVHLADRGARDLLGNQLKGINLGRLAPASGLEAFVRDARTESREGFRFDLPARGGQASRALQATVVPLLTHPGETDPGMRVVLLLDSSRRRVTSELLRMQEYAIPRSEVGVLVDAARRAFGPDSLIGPSPAMEAVRRAVIAAAGVREPVLVRGEAGSGKQHVARAIHFGGHVGGGHFIPVSCRAQNEQHLESEIFGHVKGAHADALADQPGALHKGEHGTVYFDGIDALSPALQAKLLVALKEGQLTRAGTQRPEKVEVRVIASTRERLEDAVADGRFDAELAEHLSAHDIRMTPLRERPEDVRALVQHFAEHGSRPGRWEIDEEVVPVLQGYAWEQNVRDLKACVERACARAQEGRLTLEDLSGDLRGSAGDLAQHDLQPMPQKAKPPVVGLGANTGGAAATGPYSDWLIGPDDPISFEAYERKVILRALDATHGDKLKAAKLLKVGKSTLYRKLKRYGIS